MKNNLVNDQLVYTGESTTITHLSLINYGPEKVDEWQGDTFEEIQPYIDDEHINWIQINGMTNTKIIRQVCEYFEINFLVIQDILNANHPTKIEEHEKYTVLVLKIFTYNGTEELGEQQLSIIQGCNFIISFIENEARFFENISKAIHSNVIKIRTKETDYLLSVLLNNVMSNYTNVISEIEDALEELEEELLMITKNRDVGIMIQLRRRQYMSMKKAIMPLKEQYVKLLRLDNKLIHKTSRAYFNDVNDHLQFVLQTMEACRETLSSLVDLYISNNGLRMNDIMKRLTVVSTIFIPLTFLAGVWGMNFENMPELTWEYGYWTAWLCMLLVATLIYLFFKKKKWY